MCAQIKVVFDEKPDERMASAFLSQIRKLRGISYAEPVREPPPNSSKGIGAIVWSEILVEVLKDIAPDAFSGLVNWLKSWLKSPDARAVKLKVTLPDGSILEIDPGLDSPNSIRKKVDAYRSAFSENKK